MGVLRGTADRQRDARHAPRRGARLQGRLPPLPDHEGLPRPAAGRLGLPWPAGRDRSREGARLHQQTGHRGVRHRGVQRQVSRVGPAPCRRVRGHDRAHGVLGRFRDGLPDHGPLLRRVGVVVAQADLRQGIARPGPPGHALVPARRHAAVRPRAGAGLRDRRGPVGLRAVPADRWPAGRRRRAAGLDDDAVDARVQHRRRRAPRRDLCRRAVADGSERLVVAEPLLASALGSDWTVVGSYHGRDMEGWTYQPPFELIEFPEGSRAHFVVVDTYVTTEDGSGLVHQAPAFGADDLRVAQAYGLPVVNPIRPDGTFVESTRLVGGQFFKQADEALVRDLRTRGAAAAARPVRAPVPALLALPHAADLLRAAVLVHPHDRGQGRAAAGERAHQLGPGEREVGPLRRLAAQQRRLGAVAQPVLGYATADLALRRAGTSSASARSPSSASTPGRTCRRSTRTGRSSTT